MDALEKVFFSVPTLLLCIGIFLMTYVVRTIVETAQPGIKTNKWWREVALPLGPIGTGVILAFVAHSYAWPDVVADPWSRLFYGGACGVASGWVYSRFRSILGAWSPGHPFPVPGTEDTAPVAEDEAPPPVTLPPTDKL
jgi:hypothetical protein